MARMSKTGRRRFNVQTAAFRQLIENEPVRFRREWKKRVLGWLYEIHRRARDWNTGIEFRNTENVDGLIEQGRMQVFGVVECADSFIAACGVKCEKLVGKETRELLNAECVTAVARVIDRRLNHMSKSYRGGRL